MSEHRQSYRLNEWFWTIQGEGVHAGATALFLRLQGCPVGCWFCDSKLTWYNGGTETPLATIRDIASAHPASQVVITGGEPLIHNLDALVQMLRAQNPHRMIALETSGAYPIRGHHVPDWITLSPKAAADWRIDPYILTYADELKYVVDEAFDPAIVHQHLAERRQLGGSPPVVGIMPEGAPPRDEMIRRTLEILRDHPAWRFSPRLQYDYAPITDIEGMNNRIISASDARTITRGERAHG